MSTTKYTANNAADALTQLKAILGDSVNNYKVLTECVATGKITMSNGKEKIICNKSNMVAYFAKKFDVSLTADENNPLHFVHQVDDTDSTAATDTTATPSETSDSTSAATEETTTASATTDESTAETTTSTDTTAAADTTTESTTSDAAAS